MTKKSNLVKTKAETLRHYLNQAKEVQVWFINNGEELTKEQRQTIVNIWNALDTASENAFSLENSIK